MWLNLVVKITLLLTIITTFFLNSCASNFYQVPIAQGNIISVNMLSELENGLSKAQVQYIMGTPSINDPFDSDRWDYVGYETIGDEVLREVHHTLIFKDDKLVSWVKKKGKAANQSFEEEAKKLNKEKSEQ